MKAWGYDVKVKAYIVNRANLSADVFASTAFLSQIVSSMGGAPPLKVGGSYPRYRNFIKEGWAPGSFFGARLPLACPAGRTTAINPSNPTGAGGVCLQAGQVPFTVPGSGTTPGQPSTEAQLLAYLETGVWRRNAAHANALAQELGLPALRLAVGLDLLRARRRRRPPAAGRRPRPRHRRAAPAAVDAERVRAAACRAGLGNAPVGAEVIADGAGLQQGCRGIVGVLLAHGLDLHQLAVAIGLQLRGGQRGLGPLERGLGGIDRSLVGGGVDLIEQFAGLDQAALGEGAALDDAADLRPDLRAAIGKSNAYTGLLNRTLRAIESWERYTSWVNLKTGPTGRERYITYGLYSLYDVRDEIQRARIAIDAPPSSPELDAAMKRYIEAYEALAPVITQAYGYYERKDYKADNMAEGKALHVKLAPAAETFLRERKQVDALFRPFKLQLDLRELALPVAGQRRGGQAELRVLDQPDDVQALLRDDQGATVG